MLKNIDLKYGRSGIRFDLPDTTPVLRIRDPEFRINRKAFEEKFSSALPDDLEQCRSVAIVVADKTRLCDYDLYLPWVLDVLYENGVENKAVTFFIAYGTHARQTDEDCLRIYGDVFLTHPFIHHNCEDRSLFAPAGKTELNTPIHIRRDILESDLVITFGALSHHYFAGYGGGRKLLFPGLGYKPDIYHNHSLFLDRTAGCLHPGNRPGNLDANPLAQDLKQVDDALQTRRIAIHGILDSKGKVCDLIVGKTWDDFLSACHHLDSFYKKDAPGLYDLVLASCGGFPKDINFIQSHKAVNNAAMFVKDKGTLVILAECRDGIGSDTYLEYFGYQGFKGAFEVLEKDYQGNGGTALSMMTKTSRIKIFLKTALDDRICRKMGIKKIDIPLIEQYIHKFQHSMACIENASLLIR